MAEYRTVKVKDLTAHPDNLRGDIEEADVLELRRSIEHIGLKQNLVGYEENGHIVLTAGHRRLKALLGTNIREVTVLIEDQGGDAADIFTMLAENLHREDLDVFAEGTGYRLLREEYGQTVKAIAEKHGVSHAHVSRRIQLTKLPEVLRRFVPLPGVDMETWVALAGIVSEIPELALDELVSELDDSLKYNRIGIDDYPVVNLINQHTRAKLRLKAERELDKAGWTKPVVWTLAELWKFPKAADEVIERGKEIDPKSLSGARARGIFVDIDAGAKKITYQEIKGRKYVKPEPETKEVVDPETGEVTTITAPRNWYTLAREVMTETAIKRMGAAGLAVAKAKDADLLNFSIWWVIQQFMNNPNLVTDYGMYVLGETEGEDRKVLAERVSKELTTKSGRLRVMAFVAMHDEIQDSMVQPYSNKDYTRAQLGELDDKVVEFITDHIPEYEDPWAEAIGLDAMEEEQETDADEQ